MSEIKIPVKFVRNFAKLAQVKQVEAKRYLCFTLALLIEEVKIAPVTFPGFGTFKLKECKERRITKSYLLDDGETRIVPARTKLQFRCSKGLKLK